MCCLGKNEEIQDRNPVAIESAGNAVTPRLSFLLLNYYLNRKPKAYFANIYLNML